MMAETGNDGRDTAMLDGAATFGLKPESSEPSVFSRARPIGALLPVAIPPTVRNAPPIRILPSGWTITEFTLPPVIAGLKPASSVPLVLYRARRLRAVVPTLENAPPMITLPSAGWTAIELTGPSGSEAYAESTIAVVPFTWTKFLEVAPTVFPEESNMSPIPLNEPPRKTVPSGWTAIALTCPSAFRANVLSQAESEKMRTALVA